jgi:hypothetical protein
LLRNDDLGLLLFGYGVGGCVVLFRGGRQPAFLEKKKGSDVFFLLAAYAACCFLPPRKNK